MKFSILTLLATAVATVSAHTTMNFPPPRGHPNNPNAAVKDFQCISAPLNGGGGCAPKAFPCGGYPADRQVGTTLTAGQVITVNFFNQNLPQGKNSDPGANQARHNGGLCEFSLSYDGGKTFTKIATYHKTCPDIFFDWKVKIPDNAPSCNTPGKCLFSWSWINAVGNREFYQNCADVKIVGKAKTPLPKTGITLANLPQFNNIITPEGDPLNSGNAKGSGPLQADITANLGLQIGNTLNNVTKPAQPKSPKSKSPKSKKLKSKSPKSKKPKSKKSEKSQIPKAQLGSGDVCSENGAMVCVDAGNSPEFNTCDNGNIVKRICPRGLVCQDAGQGQIACNFPKRR